MSNSLQLHGLLHTRPLCPSPSPEVYPSSYPLHQRSHPASSSSDALFSFCPQPFPASGTFPMSQLFTSGDQNIGASASASGLISLKIDWFDLLAVQGIIRSLLKHHNLKASILQPSAFFTVQVSQLHITTGETIALTLWTFVGRVMSLLFKTLSQFSFSQD